MYDKKSKENEIKRHPHNTHYKKETTSITKVLAGKTRSPEEYAFRRFRFCRHISTNRKHAAAKEKSDRIEEHESVLAFGARYQPFVASIER